LKELADRRDDPHRPTHFMRFWRGRRFLEQARQ
jgi:hypothetical protein